MKFLDTDWYKLTMGAFAFEFLPDAEVKYEFKRRGPFQKFSSEQVGKISDKLDELSHVQLTQEEYDYLKHEYPVTFTEDYLNFLKSKKFFNRDNLYVKHLEDGSLKLEVHGKWKDVIYFEIPVLSIISEILCEGLPSCPIGHTIAKLRGCGEPDQPMKVYEFGTRRRYSKEYHYNLVETLAKEKRNQWNFPFEGTSNVWLSKELKLHPIGSMAHEYLQVFQAVAKDFDMFQVEALYKWMVYAQDRNLRCIALTDVVDTETFLNDFRREKLYDEYDGVRHDSGDPVEWAENVIDFYHKNRINPKQKILLFSNGLEIGDCRRLFNKFKNLADVRFAMGGGLANPAISMNIVLKITECNGRPVAKLTDDLGKHFGKEEAVRRLIDLKYAKQNSL